MGGNYRWELSSEILNDYWQIFIGFITLVVILAKMKSDIDILKEKVGTLFELWNQRKE